jgi:hypothetical protein
MSLREALDRTLLLMRDDVQDAASDDELLAALTQTTVAIVSDEKNLSSHSAQSAFVTLAMLLARSGHQVFLSAPDTPLVGPQPPLATGDIVGQLQVTGLDLLPGITFARGLRKQDADLTVVFGNTFWKGDPAKTVRLYATDWFARMTRADLDEIWPNSSWPIGGMAAAALAAPEAFKVSMRKLSRWAKNPEFFAEQYAQVSGVELNLALSNSAKISNLGRIDFVSGGAITNCALYCLLRLPNVASSARIIEDDIIALSNLNRCMLLLRSQLDRLKADGLAHYSTNNFLIKPIPKRYIAATSGEIRPFAHAVFVGVDDIPARWDVQRVWPKWLGIGATGHFSVMASYHTPATSCAGCLHPTDEQGAQTIPTVAFVSFWAGLWQATYYLRYLAKDRFLSRDQHIYFTPLRPENPWQGPVQRHLKCPVGCGAQPAHHAS